MVARIVTLIAALVVAAIGAGLVILYALQADERAGAQYEGVDVVVANAFIPAGTVLGELTEDPDVTALTTRPVPEISVVAGAWRDQVPAGREDLVFLMDVYPGEQLFDDKLASPAEAADPLRLAPPPQAEGEEQDEQDGGRSAIVVSLPDSQRGSSWLRAGARVAVVLDEQSPPEGREPRTCVLMPEMQIIAVGSRTDLAAAGVTQEPVTTQPGQPAVPDSFIALDVEQESALKITRAQNRGPLSFILRPDEGGPEFEVDCYTDEQLSLELG